MKYILKRKFFHLLGKEFSITDENGLLVAYAKQKAFKLKEEITIFSDREMKSAIVSIKARNIIDFSATYDVVDMATTEIIGVLQRKGVKSIFRDEWAIFTKTNNEIGLVKEDSGALALVRRLLTNLVPQRFDLRIGTDDAGGFQQKFNLFQYVLEIEFEESLINKHMAFAIAVLLAAVEGRQE